MNWYQLLLDDVNAIDRQREELLLKAQRHSGMELTAYRPLPFTDHTGFTETVEEEIEFVIACQQADQGAYCDVDRFIQEWKLSDFRNQRVVALSGGWRKFLGLALFSNRKTAGKFYFDAASHLADERLVLLFDRLESNGEQCVVFCEYDSLLLARLHPGCRLLHDVGDRIEAVDRPPAPRNLDSQTQTMTNYEQALA